MSREPADTFNLELHVLSQGLKKVESVRDLDF